MILRAPRCLIMVGTREDGDRLERCANVGRAGREIRRY